MIEMQALKDQVGWFVRKLVSKDPLYSARRFSYAVRKRTVDRAFPTIPMRRRASQEVPYGSARMCTYYLQRKLPQWHWDMGDVENVVRRIPDLIKGRNVKIAESIAGGCFTFVGHEPVKLDPVDWTYAPNGDLTWTRELNRHSTFETLGFAYRYTGDTGFARAFMKLSDSWMASNTGRIGKLPWDTPFQVARRINSWIWSFFLFVDCSQWKDSSQRKFVSTLGLLAEYLYQTIEYHSPGNHILLEAKTLAFCGEVFPEYLGARRWRKKGWWILNREIARQICEDGVHAERSTMYHRIIAGELAELWLLCERNDLSRSERLRGVVMRMAEFQRSIDLGDGTYPLFGDSRSEDSYYRLSAPTIMESFRSGNTAILEKGVADHTWWVLPAGPNVSVDIPGNKMFSRACAFSEGGYYVSRSNSPFGQSVLVWDCGPFGYALNRKHAHADALSFVLSLGGQPILIDPGVGGPRESIGREGHIGQKKIVAHWRELRKTRAHNTVCIDGEDQAVLARRNEIWNPPDPELVLWTFDEAYHVLWGQHDGYCRLRDPVLHDRVIVTAVDRYWLVLDRFSGSGSHTAELRYHVVPGASLRACLPSRVEIKKENIGLDLTFFAPKGEAYSIAVDREEVLGELRGGSPERIPVLRGRCTAGVPFLMGTLLTCPPSGMRLREATVKGADYEIEVGNDESSDHILVHMGLKTDAMVDIQRCDASDGSEFRKFFLGKTGQHES